MGLLTTQLRQRAKKVADRPELPGWWSLAPILGGCAIVVAVAWSALSGPAPQPGLSAPLPDLVEATPVLPPAPTPAASATSVGPAPSAVPGGDVWALPGVPSAAIEAAATVTLARATGRWDMVPAAWPVPRRAETDPSPSASLRDPILEDSTGSVLRISFVVDPSGFPDAQSRRAAGVLVVNQAGLWVVTG
jgi:hypothetical protein